MINVFNLLSLTAVGDEWIEAGAVGDYKQASGCPLEALRSPEDQLWGHGVALRQRRTPRLLGSSKILSSSTGALFNHHANIGSSNLRCQIT